MRRLHAPRSAAGQRGAGALVVVMVLFFIMSLVAAYAGRNLIFEQKISANNYRTTTAFEAADAGVDWAIAMLNGGRIDASCTGTADPNASTFRDRYLVVQPDGRINPGPNPESMPTCVRTGTNWTCSCPTSGAPTLAAPTVDTPTPAFRIQFEAVAQPGLVRVNTIGCSNFGSTCYAASSSTADATAALSVLVGLAPSLVQPPVAAFTVRGRLDATGAVRVVNSDPAARGITIDAGAADDVFTHAPSLVVATTPGSPAAQSIVTNDSGLSGIVDQSGMTAGERMFLATFGTSPQGYRVHPAVVRIACDAECSTELGDAAQRFPGRVLWVDGDLDIDAPVTIGTVTAPVILVVADDINLGSAADVTINGLVYSRGANWTNAGGSALVRGGFIAEGRDDSGASGLFTISGAPTIVWDPAIVDRLKLAQVRQVPDFGSFARVPGSWRDIGQ